MTSSQMNSYRKKFRTTPHQQFFQMKSILVQLLITIFMSIVSYGQPLIISDHYLILNAGPDDPLYTTYTACPQRSRLYGDKGYKMCYSNRGEPLYYGSDKGGRIYTLWEINSVVIDRIGEYHKKPVVKASFPDMVILEYSPWPGLQVEETFFVYSSTLAMVDMRITNISAKSLEINLYPVFDGADSMEITGYDHEVNGYILHHYETKKRLISDLGEAYPYPTLLRDVFCSNVPNHSYGSYEGPTKDLYDKIKTDFYSENRSDSLNLETAGSASLAVLHMKFNLDSGESKQVRYSRGIQGRQEDISGLLESITQLRSEDLQRYVGHNISLFGMIPRISFTDNRNKILYLSAFNLARGCMLPPNGKTSYNFYVFSREPIWGWGHGHQVLHESLSMLSYAFLDPPSAQNSQRVYMEQQAHDGLIAYRHGPRGAQDYPHKGMPTTSAPFFSWINWELFNISNDTGFLIEAYQSGARYTSWLLDNRDSDKDGTLEWGPYGIIENVRDWYNAVFQVSAERHLDVDKEDISDELECLDLSLMAVNEMRSLSRMAGVLGKPDESMEWQAQADRMSELINERMWDDSSGFFYHVDKNDHTFNFMGRNLKREEIIGFLPMWAEAVSKERAEVLINKLTDPAKFWRTNGIPTLAADDPWYSPYVDYCCKWNGPVWMLWDYMVFEGLVKYGYSELAIELADKMINTTATQLSKNHNFWESYSPDNEVLNCPSNYIWDAILARLMIERDKLIKAEN